MRTSTDLPRRAPGSWARAAVITVMWSAAVFDPALPGRSAIANGSPVPSGPWSTNAQRVEPEPLLERRPGILLLQLAQVHGKVCKVAPGAPGSARVVGLVGVRRSRSTLSLIH